MHKHFINTNIKLKKAENILSISSKLKKLLENVHSCSWANVCYGYKTFKMEN